MYSSLIDAFEAASSLRADRMYACNLLRYTGFLVALRHLNYLCKELDRGNMCPACPKVVHYTDSQLVST